MKPLQDSYVNEEGYLSLMNDVFLFGTDRATRTGNVKSIWDAKVVFNLEEGFPALTTKRIAWKTVVGELLFFLSGSESLKTLKHYTFGDSNSDKWTIWTDDTERWHKTLGYTVDPNFVGALYPVQWRNYNHSGVDQIQNLITSLRESPQERNHIVMAWNPEAIASNSMSLKPCHLGFQCYVDAESNLHLKWWQRSVDTFLGLPFNIASYALLTHLLAKWCGLGVGTVTGDLGDVHVYDNQRDAVNEMLGNTPLKSPNLRLPKGTETLDSTLKLTSEDFSDSLHQYQHHGTIKAPLSVG